MALVGTGFGYSPQRRAAQAAVLAGVLPHVRDVRRIGSAALDLCMVAAGRLDAFYEHGLNRWDWAAGALIAAEAGAQLQLPGRTAPELTLVAAPGIAADLRDLLEWLGAHDELPTRLARVAGVDLRQQGKVRRGAWPPAAGSPASRRCRRCG